MTISNPELFGGFNVPGVTVRRAGEDMIVPTFDESVERRPGYHVHSHEPMGGLAAGVSVGHAVWERNEDPTGSVIDAWHRHWRNSGEHQVL